ncbi:MAG: YceI family protein [Planctomycetes bacterium]|nr:YceI family protein [Planctomycetota bacterium]MCB9919207.1 YceI family protein [Planctomycetota bacterium]
MNRPTMIRSILVTLGVFALIAWTAIGAAAWWSVQSKIHVTIADDDANSHGVSEIALLRDTVQTIHGDLASLRADLGKSFGELATQLDGAAEDRSTRTVATLEARLAGLESRLQRTEAALQSQREAAEQQRAALTDRLQTIAQSIKNRPAVLPGAGNDSAAPPPVTVPAITTPEDASPAVTSPAVTSPAVTSPAVTSPAVAQAPEAAAPLEPSPEEIQSTPAAPTKTPAKTRFLSFSIASSGVDFGAKTRFVVLPALSRVGFDAKSTLHDFTGVTSKLEGNLETTLENPAAGASGAISVDASSLVTGLDGRDEAMREHLDTTHHDKIEFRLESIADAVSDTETKAVRGTAKGTMTIRGKSNAFTMPIEMKLDDAQRLVVEGQGSLDLPDYEVPVPNKLGLISMNKTVKVWIALRMRAQRGE